MNKSVERILENAEYCTIATVCEDGAPWNVPVRFAYDEKYIYFRSPSGTMHGSNIERDGRVAIVIFDTNQSVKGAVYVRSPVERLDSAHEAVAIQVFNSRYNNPSNQWNKTEYHRAEIGDLDEARTKAEMYYFEARGFSK